MAKFFALRIDMDEDRIGEVPDKLREKALEYIKSHKNEVR